MYIVDMTNQRTFQPMRGCKDPNRYDQSEDVLSEAGEYTI